MYGCDAKKRREKGKKGGNIPIWGESKEGKWGRKERENQTLPQLANLTWPNFPFPTTFNDNNGAKMTPTPRSIYPSSIFTLKTTRGSSILRKIPTVDVSALGGDPPNLKHFCSITTTNKLSSTLGTKPKQCLRHWSEFGVRSKTPILGFSDGF